jgi:hypothetical protein
VTGIEGAPLHQARAAKEKLRRMLREVPEIRGIGIAPSGDGYVVKVNLASQPDDLDVPSSIDDVPVVVVVVGRIEAL